MCLLKRALVVIFLIVNSLASAKTYYVATTGNDNNNGLHPTYTSGSNGPWATWAHAFAYTQSGDTCYFRGGVYYSTAPIIPDGRYPGQSYGFYNGTVGHNTCFWGYPPDIANGDSAILDCQRHTANPNYALYLKYVSYVHLKNLTFRNVYQTAYAAVVEAVQTMYDCNEVIFEACTVYRASGCGFQSVNYQTLSNDVHRIYYINCDAHMCRDSTSGNTPGQYGTGFTASNEYSDNWECYFIGCRAWECSDQGFAGRPRGMVVYQNCWAMDNDGWSTGDGHGFKPTATDTYYASPAIQRKVVNCIAANNAFSGFNSNDNGKPPMRCVWYNNFSYHNGYKGKTEYDSGSGFRMLTCSGDGTSRIERNNIGYANEHYESFSENAITHDHNSWDLPVTVNAADFQSLDYTQLYRPRKADGSLPDITFGKLVTGSDLINKGVNVGLPYSDYAPDLGAFEYSGTESGFIPVTSITVSGAGGATTITTDNGTLQLSATVLPSDATNKTVTWSISNGTGQATINSSGLVTAVSNGIVNARATANDGSRIYGTLTITISNQMIPVSGITVTGAGGATTITADNGTLQLSTAVLPANATNKTITWSISSGTDKASISPTGLVTALDNGAAVARATANDGSGVYGTLTITVTNQVIPVTGITVTGAGGATTITTDGGTLQLSAAVLPANATNKAVTWSISSGVDKASISSTGLMTALDNGTAIARATANDGSGVYGTLTITVTNQVIPVTGITITGAGGATTITTNGGTLQLSAAVLPANATNKTVTWSISSGTDKATISSTGLVTAIDNGTAVARATANDGSGVFGTLTITITNQIIPVSGITLTGAGGSTTISTDNGPLQLTAAVLPANATNKTVTWSISSGTDKASISSTGLVTALDNGTAVARATANDGSGVYGTLTITILNQVIPVAGITVTGAGGSTTISTDNGTLQLSAAILPANATIQTVTWSISGGTDKATISSTGLVTALDNGTTVARATANDGSGVYALLTLTITNQVVTVTGITVTGTGGATQITSIGGTLQLNAAIIPSNATNKTVTWSISSGTDKASISSTGIVTALDNGTAVARATANDGSGVYGTLTVTITNQFIPVTDITVTGAGGAIAIITDNGTLQLYASIFPSNATIKTVTWSISSGTDKASISSTGLVTALDNGTAVAMATANDGTGIYGTFTITILNQVIPVISIEISGLGGATAISTDNGSLQLNSTVTPSNATIQSVTWTISSGADKATISSTGLVTALDNGTAVARATANDGSGVYSTLTIAITNQVVSVTGIKVTGSGGTKTIKTNKGHLKLNATVSPLNATTKTVTWSISSETKGTDVASIDTTGLVTAIDNGTAVARATANDGSGVFDTLTITITNQVITVSGITISATGGATTISTDNGTLQLNATMSPLNATNQSITWSISSGTDKATISSAGLVTAIDNGTVVAMATANDGSGVYGTLAIMISNQIIPISPVYVSSVVENISPSQVELTYDLQLANVIPPSSAFIVFVNSIARNITNVTISGANVLLTLSSPVVSKDNISVTYIVPELNPLQSLSGGIAATISNQPVTNKINQAIPEFISASVENQTPSRVEMNYSISLANIIPSLSSFIVVINSSQIPVTAVTISGLKVYLTLANPIFSGDIITLTYTKPSLNPIQSSTGEQAVSLNNQSVSNNVTTINSPPVIVVNYQAKSYSGFVDEINASGSYDIDKDNLSFTWTAPSNVAVSSTNGASIRYLGPNVNSNETINFTLNISDGKTTKSRIIPIEILPYKPELEVIKITKVDASGYEPPYFPYNIIDGNIGTMWAAEGENQWLILKFDHSYDIQHVRLAFQPGQKSEAYFDILGSTDSIGWEPILIKSASCGFSGDMQVFEFPDSKQTREYNYLKLIGRCNSIDSWNYVSEIKVFGYRGRNMLAYEDLPVKIYPNPASEYITVRVDESSLRADLLQIVGISGNIVYQEKLDPDLKEFNIPLNLKTGTYIVQMSIDKITLFTQKLVVIR